MIRLEELWRLHGNRRVRFTAPGWNGRPHEGRGIVRNIVHNGVLLVELTRDDFGGFGTYRTGAEIRVSPSELISKQ